jgi:3-keto-L-gulonate-6-phosphate decarboxylase
MADLKIMDGGCLEAEVMAKAGAHFVVVMGRTYSPADDPAARLAS